MSDAKETVYDPDWYTSGDVETIDKIEAVIDGLPACEAFLLGQVIRYVDRAGEKDDPATDLGKANNYAHRLVTGEWRSDERVDRNRRKTALRPRTAPWRVLARGRSLSDLQRRLRRFKTQIYEMRKTQ